MSVSILRAEFMFSRSLRYICMFSYAVGTGRYKEVDDVERFIAWLLEDKSE